MKRLISLLLLLSIVLSMLAVSPAAFATGWESGETDPTEQIEPDASCDAPVVDDGTGVPDVPPETDNDADPADDESDALDVPSETDDANPADGGSDALDVPSENDDADPAADGANTDDVPPETDDNPPPESNDEAEPSAEEELVSYNVTSGKCGDNLTWILDYNTGTLTISGYGAMYDFADAPDGMVSRVDTPWPLNTGLITNIVLPDGLTYIGSAAFFSTNLTSITLPSSLSSIGDYAFMSCPNLTSISFPDRLESIGFGAFAGCSSLSSINFSSSITTIEGFAFIECPSLTHVDLPAGLVSLGLSPFAGSPLSSISVSDDNPNFRSVDGVLFNKSMTSLVDYPSNRSGAYSVPQGVVSIEIAAFVETANLTSIEFPTSLRSIGTAAFSACSNLSTITFLGDMPTLALDGAGVFADVTATVYYPGGNPSYTADNMLDYGGKLTWVAQGASNGPVAAFVQRAYDLILNREPDEQGLNDWVNALRSGSVTGGTLVNGFVSSPEFLSRGLSNEEVVEILYAVMLDRVPDEGGKALWQGFLDNGMSYTFIVSGFVGSPEFQGICSGYGINPGTVSLTESRDMNAKVTAFVSRNYRLILQRTPDTGGLNAWTSALLSGTQTGAAVVNGFVLSPEFTSRGLASDKVVEILYNVMLDRVPDEGGKAVWVNYLNQGHNYTDLVNGFAGSPEFQGICADAGITAGWA